MVAFRTACDRHIMVRPRALRALETNRVPLALLKRALHQVELPKKGVLRKTISFEENIGENRLVEVSHMTTETEGWFASFHGQGLPAHVALVPSSGVQDHRLTVLARPFSANNGRKNFDLISAWVGPLAPSQPWDPTITKYSDALESLDFWTKHALIWNSRQMQAPFRSTWKEVLSKVPSWQ